MVSTPPPHCSFEHFIIVIYFVLLAIRIRLMRMYIQKCLPSLGRRKHNGNISIFFLNIKEKLVKKCSVLLFFVIENENFPFHYIKDDVWLLIFHQRDGVQTEHELPPSSSFLTNIFHLKIRVKSWNISVVKYFFDVHATFTNICFLLFIPNMQDTVHILAMEWWYSQITLVIQDIQMPINAVDRMLEQLVLVFIHLQLVEPTHPAQHPVMLCHLHNIFHNMINYYLKMGKFK